MLVSMPDRERRDLEERSKIQPSLKRISTSELMAGEREIILDHDGKEYRLRVTALGKLILTR